MATVIFPFAIAHTFLAGKGHPPAFIVKERHARQLRAAGGGGLGQDAGEGGVECPPPVASWEEAAGSFGVCDALNAKGERGEAAAELEF